MVGMAPVEPPGLDRPRNFQTAFLVKIKHQN
jgi:hypothetical protein